MAGVGASDVELGGSGAAGAAGRGRGAEGASGARGGGRGADGGATSEGGRRGQGASVLTRRVEGRRGCCTSWQAMLRVLQTSPRGQQAFVGIAFLQLVILLAERCFVLAVAEERGLPMLVPVWFLFIVLVSTGFMLYYALRAVVYSNYAMFRVFLVANALLLARIVAEFASRSRGETVCTGGAEGGCLAFLVVDVLVFLVQVVMSYVLMTELQWKRYKALGSSPKLAASFGMWELFSSTLLLDLQLSLVVLVTGLAFFQLSSPVQFGINLFLVLIEVAWHHHGWTGARLASWELMAIFWVLSIFLPVFLISVAIDVATNTLPKLAGQDATVLGIVAFVAITALLNRIVTVVVSILIYRDFGPDWDRVRAILDRGVDPFRKGRLRQRDALRHQPNPSSSNPSSSAVADWDSNGAPVFSGGASDAEEHASDTTRTNPLQSLSLPPPDAAEQRPPPEQLHQVPALALGSVHEVGLGPADDGEVASNTEALIRTHSSPPPQDDGANVEVGADADSDAESDA